MMCFLLATRWSPNFESRRYYSFLQRPPKITNSQTLWGWPEPKTMPVIYIICVCIYIYIYLYTYAYNEQCIVLDVEICRFVKALRIGHVMLIMRAHVFNKTHTYYWRFISIIRGKICESGNVIIKQDQPTNPNSVTKYFLRNTSYFKSLVRSSPVTIPW